MITSTGREGGEGTSIKQSIMTTNIQASKHAASNTRVSELASKIRKRQVVWMEGGREGGQAGR